MLKNKEYITTQKFKIYFSPAEPYHPHPKYFWKNCNKKDFFEFPISKAKIIDIPFVSAILLMIGYLPTRFVYSLGRGNKILNFNVHVNEFTDIKHLKSIKPDFILAKKYLEIPLKKRIAFFDKLFQMIKKDYELLTLEEIAKRLNE